MADKDNEPVMAIATGLHEARKQRRISSEKERPGRSRVHRSIYLDQAIYDRLGDAYRATSHELYPLEVRKSSFIEACIAYALDHLPDIETALRKIRP